LSAVICQKSTGLSTVFETARDAYGLGHDVVNDVIASTFDEVEAIAESLNVELNRQKDVLDIMEKANTALGKLSERLSTEKECAAPGTLPSFESLGEEKERKAVEQTLQAVAHEIRNPLTSVGGFVKKLASTLAPSSKGWEYAQIILEEARKLEQALSHMSQKVPRS
jgi:nitrogen-specific signal transduction histidine kinase